MPRNVLALDQGTTSSRAIVFSPDGVVRATAQQEFPQILPHPGHVLHDPEAIWKSQLDVAQQAVAAVGGPSEIACLGLTNQRETTVLWERDSGRPLDHAIVWQSRITADICEQLRRDGWEDTFREKTGLLLDPYFSGTKLKYLLDLHDPKRERAQRGEILFGTIDAFLLWRLTGGRVHATDYSNASRTLMLDLRQLQWDEELLEALDVPRAILPRLCDSSGFIAETSPELFGKPIVISGVAGDQQAAAFGQCCYAPGMAKNTYGTGSFLLLNTGPQPTVSQHRLLSTVGWKIGSDVTYCLEGSVFVAGAAVQWLRDGLGLIRNSADIQALAGQVADSGGVYFVPAFVGLGAPYWDPHARGAVLGLTRGATAAHLARAVIEAMAFQSWELIEAMNKDTARPLTELRVDGGAAVNDLLMQFQADLLNTSVRRPAVLETTAQGAAYLAGLAVGVWADQDELQALWAEDRVFAPRMTEEDRADRTSRWRDAVQRCLQWEQTQ